MFSSAGTADAPLAPGFSAWATQPYPAALTPPTPPTQPRAPVPAPAARAPARATGVELLEMESAWASYDKRYSVVPVRAESYTREDQVRAKRDDRVRLSGGGGGGDALLVAHLGACAEFFSAREMSRKLDRITDAVQASTAPAAIVFATGACTGDVARAGDLRDYIDAWQSARSGDGTAAIFYRERELHAQDVAAPKPADAGWLCAAALVSRASGDVLAVAVCANLHAATAHLAPSVRECEAAQAALIDRTLAPWLRALGDAHASPLLVGVTLANSSRWTFDARLPALSARRALVADDACEAAADALQGYSARDAPLPSSGPYGEALWLPPPPPPELAAHAAAPLGYYALLRALPDAPLQSSHGAVARIKPFALPERLTLTPGSTPDARAPARRTWVELARTPSSGRDDLRPSAYDWLAASNPPDCARPLRLQAALAADVPLLALYSVEPEPERERGTKRERPSPTPPRERRMRRQSSGDARPRALVFD